MKKQLTLETDRKSVKEGEFIDIRWDCTVCPESMILTFDSGYKIDRIMVSDCGSTRIPVPGCKGSFVIGLTAVINGKRLKEQVKVHVAVNKKSKSSSKVNRFRLWREKLYSGWCVFRAQMKYWWLSQKKWQKALWIALLALWLGLIVFSIAKPSHDISSQNNQTAYITEHI